MQEMTPMTSSSLDVFDRSPEFKTWKKYQDLKNYIKLVEDATLFHITYYSALRSYLRPDGVVGSQTERQYSVDYKTAGFKSFLQKCVEKIRELLILGLKERKSSSFYVYHIPHKSHVLLDKELFEHSDGGETLQSKYLLGYSKWVYDFYVTPVLPNLGKLLGAKVIETSSDRTIRQSYVLGMISFSELTETVKKVIFHWNRVTILHPLIIPKEALQGGSWEEFLRSLQKEGTLCDMSLKMQGVEIRIHKVVLYKKECKHLEGVENLVVAPETLESFIDFLYMSEREFVDMMRFHDKPSRIKPLMEMAERHKIAPLMRCCVVLLNYFASTWGVEEFKASFSGVDHPDVQEMIRSLEK